LGPDVAQLAITRDDYSKALVARFECVSRAECQRVLSASLFNNP